MADRGGIVAGALLLAAGLTGCGADSAGDETAATEKGVLYGVGDDHALWRWEVGSDQAESVLDLSGVWEGEGDVGTVLTASLSIDPTARHAAWIAGGGPEAELMIGDLETGEVQGAVPYPIDHACVDPVWAPDGSKLLVHRAPVWDEQASGGDAIPAPAEVFGPVEWYASDGEPLPETVELDRGCRLRWYTAEGRTEGLYRDLAVTELYRVDETGAKLDTIPIDSLTGVDPEVTDLVEVDPSGRYACLADGYDESESYEGGFTTRPESGTNVVDLESGESVGSDCESLQDDGYLAREGGTVRFVDYEGDVRWEANLPGELAHSPNLFHFP